MNFSFLFFLTWPPLCIGILFLLRHALSSFHFCTYIVPLFLSGPFIYIFRSPTLFNYGYHPMERFVHFHSWVIVVILCSSEDLKHSGQHPAFPSSPFSLQGLTFSFMPLTLSPAKLLSISRVMSFPDWRTHSRKVGMD